MDQEGFGFALKIHKKETIHKNIQFIEFISNILSGLIQKDKSALHNKNHQEIVYSTSKVLI
jgi:hypothetical protein